jgi:alpha-beta hydrolase superfamily lysophospholipase
MMDERLVIEVDNENIVGVLHWPKTQTTSCIITAHGLLSNKDSVKYLTLAKGLQERGIATFRFDFRGCGESGGRLEYSHITNRENDLKAVTEHMTQKMGFQNIGLFGSSMGGFVSYLMPSSIKQVKAMVTLAAPISMAELFNTRDIASAYAQYEIDGIIFKNDFITDVLQCGTLSKELLNSIDCPVLIFHGTMDGLVPISHAERLFENIKGQKLLKIIKFGDHIFSNPYHLEEIIRTSIDWFDKYMPGD